MKQIYEVFWLPNNLNNHAIWRSALTQFNDSLYREVDPNTLERIILQNSMFDLHIEGAMALMRKAKKMGCNSPEFMKSYILFMGGHVSPDDPEFNLFVANDESIIEYIGD